MSKTLSGHIYFASESIKINNILKNVIYSTTKYIFFCKTNERGTNGEK